MKLNSAFSIAARLKSFGHALRGIAVTIRTQPNAILHLLATLVVVVAGCYTGLAAGEWAVIVLVIGFVWAMEAMNTALEALCDRLHPEIHPSIRDAKDAAAAAVLLAALAAVAIAVFVFLPKWGWI